MAMKPAAKPAGKRPPFEGSKFDKDPKGYVEGGKKDIARDKKEMKTMKAAYK